MIKNMKYLELVKLAEISIWELTSYVTPNK